MYHHPWLGKVYYRGVDLREFVNSDISFLENAYVLLKGSYNSLDEISKELDENDEYYATTFCIMPPSAHHYKPIKIMNTPTQINRKPSSNGDISIFISLSHSYINLSFIHFLLKN